MTRAVHRFEGGGALVDIEDEHIVFIVFPVTRCLPEFGGENVGRDDFVSVSCVSGGDVSTHPLYTLSSGTPP